GDCLRHHRGAEPPRDPEPAGLVRPVGRRDRTSTRDGAAGRVEAPAGAARGRRRGIDRGRATPCLPAEAGTAAGDRRLARAVPAVLVRARRRPRATPRPHESTSNDEKDHAEKDEEKKMIAREQYTPGPAAGAQVQKDGEKWTLILVRELRHSPETVWQALT